MVARVILEAIVSCVVVLVAAAAPPPPHHWDPSLGVYGLDARQVRQH